MSEWKRVLGRKTLMLLAVLSIMNLVLFLLCCDPKKDVTLTGFELSQYIEQYPTFLKTTESNSSVMAALSLYGSGFAKENLKKIRDAYRALDGTVVTEGNNTGIVLLVEYGLTDLFLLVFLFFIVMEFRSENKKGLTFLIRSTLGGRGGLFLRRMVILFFTSVFGTILFYGSNFLCGLSIGIDNPGRSLQSLPEFLKCPYSITIAEYFLLTCLMKALAGFLIALFYYVLMGFVNPGMGYPIFIGLGALEFVAGKLIDPISSLNHLKYLNLYTFLQCREYFQDCIYLNIFGHPVSALGMMAGLSALGLLILLAGGYLIYGRKYMVRSRSGEKIFDRLAVLKERCAMQRTLPGWESYKLLVKQWGFLIVLGVFAVHWSVSAKYSYRLSQEPYQELYYVQFHGELTQDSMERVQKRKDILVESQIRMERSLQKLMEQEPVDEKKVYELSAALAVNQEQQEALEVVRKDMLDGWEYYQRTGRKVHLINPKLYHMLLNLDKKTVARASFLMLVAIVGGVSGIFAYDNQNHMNQWIRTSYRGRCFGVVCKLGVGLAICAGIAVLLHSVQYIMIQTGMDGGFYDLNAPVQSIPFMRDFPIYFSIGWYLVYLLGIRALGACLLGLIVAAISRKCQDVVTSTGISTFVMMVFAILWVNLMPG